MAFDFNDEDIDDSNAMVDNGLEYVLSLCWKEFHEITDIPELHNNPGCDITTVQRKGYWEADRYFTMHLIKELERLGFYHDVAEPQMGKSLVSGGYIGQLGNSLVFVRGRYEDLTQPFNILFKEEYKQKGNALLENSQILVFQNYVGSVRAEIRNQIYELNLPAYHCINDAVVFRGVFKATKVDDESYRLERIFDKYIFDIGKFLSYDSKRDATGGNVECHPVK